MNILDEIISFKRIEVAYNKEVSSISEMRNKMSLRHEHRSLKKRLMEGHSTGVIAEFKRKSPSQKEINLDASLPDIVEQYTATNCAGISVLTDERFFGGNLNDLKMARKHTELPILRKDFIIDDFQLYEARAHGADVILLIAACLEKEQVHDLAHHARALGLEVLLEVHSVDELEKFSPFVDIVGVNNRDLKTFETDISRSIDLYPALPAGVALISESGIHTVDAAVRLFNTGFHGLLIGGQFMKSADPGEACEAFSKDVVFQKMQQSANAR